MCRSIIAHEQILHLHNIGYLLRLSVYFCFLRIRILWTPSGNLLILTISWPTLLQNRLMSSSAAGSSANISRTSPGLILSIACFVWKSGWGQKSPTQSRVSSGFSSVTISPYSDNKLLLTMFIRLFID
jgi:hypothetical protein